MPDVFVAPEEKQDDTTIMHKRTPVPTSNAIDRVSNTFDQINPPITMQPRQETTQPFVETSQQSQPQEPVREMTPPSREGLTESPIPSPEPLHSPANIIHHNTREHHTNFAVPLFTSFWQNPHGVYFDTQEVNEHILLFLRRHFVTNVPWLFFTIIFLLLPPVATIILHLFNYSISTLPGNFINILLVAYYLSIITYAFLNFIDWYYNISLITPKRVMDVEMNNLVGKKISATKISLVQDISYQQSGTIRSIFNYGDVLIQTAGAQDNFYVHAVPKPEVVVRVVENLIGKRKGEDDDVGV